MNSRHDLKDPKSNENSCIIENLLAFTLILEFNIYIYIYRLLLKNKNIDTTTHLFHELKFNYYQTNTGLNSGCGSTSFCNRVPLGFNHVFGFPNHNFSCTQWCQYSMNMVWNLQLVGLPGLASYCPQTWAELTTGWPPFKLSYCELNANTRPWHVLCTTRKLCGSLPIFYGSLLPMMF